MAKKKQTVAEKKAKAKAYANKMTVSKGLDIYAFAGGAGRQLAGYMESDNIDWLKVGLLENYTGYNSTMGTVDLGKLSRGWGGTINRAGEKGFFRFIGIKGPRSEIKTIGDVFDWATYFGDTGFALWENKDASLREKNNIAFRKLNGIDLERTGWDAWQPNDMIMNKILPYVIQKKVRQIPQVKRIMAHINKMF